MTTTDTKALTITRHLAVPLSLPEKNEKQEALVKTLNDKDTYAKTCRACTEFVSGDQHPMWNGGRHETDQGYILVWSPEHPRATKAGYVFEQDLIAEKALGRYLQRAAVVHHHNEIRNDNGPGNLVICQDKTYHSLLHVRMRAYQATGDAKARFCSFCKIYELDPSVPMVSGQGNYHRQCRNKYVMEQRHLENNARLSNELLLPDS